MRILLTFATDHLRLPMAHSSALQGMVYHFLTCCPEYSRVLHDQGLGSTKALKFFTFSDLQGRYIPADGCLEYISPIRLELRSTEPQFIQAVLTTCVPGSRHLLNGQSLTVTECQLEAPPLFGEECRVAMLTPVTIHTTLPDRTTRFFAPTEPEFVQRLEGNAARKWQVYSGGRPFRLRIAAIHPEASRKLVTSYRSFRINAWYTVLQLSGDPQIIDLLYHAGLGDRNAQGFGMFCPV